LNNLEKDANKVSRPNNDQKLLKEIEDLKKLISDQAEDLNELRNENEELESDIVK